MKVNAQRKQKDGLCHPLDLAVTARFLEVPLQRLLRRLKVLGLQAD